MKYCSTCGATVSVSIPPGDNRERFVCAQCHAIHYQNPKIVTGCIAEWEDKILLCKRAIEPRYGMWTLPAGFMENGETSAAGAARETREEANAIVEVISLFALIDIPYINQVYLLYRARLTAPEFSSGEESLEARLVDEAGVPWEQIAFPAIHKTLRWYYEDRRAGEFQLHTGDIPTRPTAALGRPDALKTS